MKDPVKEFELLEEGIGDFFTKTLGIGDKKQKKVYQTPSKIQQGIQKHAQNIESGNECKVFGTNPNNQFFSEIGSSSAQFGNHGKVKNIIPFLNSLKFAKVNLRCYDINKDPLGIKWLFDGVYEADTIWYENGKVHFQGEWKSGPFKGVFVQTGKGHTNEPPKIEYFILQNGKKLGPYLFEKLPNLVRANILKPETLIWKKGYENWIPAKDDKHIGVFLRKPTVKKGTNSPKPSLPPPVVP